MKTVKLTFLFIIIHLSYISNVQSQTMLYDENYTETIFTEDFIDATLDRSKWDVALFKRDIGLLIDSSATVRVNNGKL
ncbi:MAG: hypothetical protein L3J11_11755 [Draconibacterium sp.]|nr:hypothetical protein [Draconibacterium sp.]